jgi:hypothetical protein
MVLLVGLPATVHAQKRVALVIGNSAYQHTPALRNPKNDAADVAAVLKDLGFEVHQGIDLPKAAMERMIHGFAEALVGAQLATFFYAGHGLQVSGLNYLVPVDAKLRSAVALDFEMIRLDVIQRAMERGTTTNIVFLDACRDNPLARNLARALGTRSATIRQGLAPVESGEGTLISFSTQPGNVALDGKGRNSPYAAALLKHIASPGQDLPTILINVRNDVMEATGRRQVPWEHSALTARVHFTPPKPTQPTVDQQIELTYWLSVKDSTNPTVLATYLERYPNGEFAPIARALITHYQQQMRAQQARRIEAEKRREEERKAAEVQRLEEERRQRDSVLAAEKKKAQDSKKADEIQRLEAARAADVQARSETLKKARFEAEAAKDAAKKAEEQRQASAKAADDAAKAAEVALASKRDAVRVTEPAKIVALPKIEKTLGATELDGDWRLVWTITTRTPGGKCGQTNTGTQAMSVKGRTFTHPGGSSTMSETGAAQWSFRGRSGETISYSGTFRSDSASGRFSNPIGCSGTFTAQRVK